MLESGSVSPWLSGTARPADETFRHGKGGDGMDWLMYWFMFPGCIVIATIAMLSGISGAALLTPVMILGFPFLHVGTLTPAAAVSMALLTEFFGFGSGVVGYYRRKLIDFMAAKTLLVVAIPAAIGGALISHTIDPMYLRVVYGGFMIVIATILLRHVRESVRNPTAIAPTTSIGRIREVNDETVIKASDGTEYRYKLCDVRGGRFYTGFGAVMAGLTSTGIGEVIMPQLVRMCKMPVAVAAATSVFVVAATVLSGSITHMAMQIVEGGLANIPWNLVIYTVPGALIGGQIGAMYQGKVSSVKMERLIAMLFYIIAILFLVSAV